MARFLVTQEMVSEAAAALEGEGMDPSIRNVQARIGGGSFSTVKRYLDAWEEQQTAKPVATVVMPPEIATKAEEWVRALWATATAQAQREAQAIKDQALAEVAAARQHLAEAMTEVQRLEAVEADLRQSLETSEQQTRKLELRVATLEVEARRVPVLEGELDAVRREHSDTSGLRSAFDQLRAQVAALVASSEASFADSRPVKKGASKATS
jgi:Plasmid replication region DNA-binding N-term